jgi:hypothetical protein
MNEALLLFAIHFIRYHPASHIHGIQSYQAPTNERYRSWPLAQTRRSSHAMDASTGQVRIDGGRGSSAGSRVATRHTASTQWPTLTYATQSSTVYCICQAAN